MSQNEAAPRFPAVNLFSRPPRRLGRVLSVPWQKAALIAIALASWSAAASAIAMLLGWHPRIPLVW